MGGLGRKAVQEADEAFGDVAGEMGQNGAEFAEFSESGFGLNWYIFIWGIEFRIERFDLLFHFLEFGQSGLFTIKM